MEIGDIEPNLFALELRLGDLETQLSDLVSEFQGLGYTLNQISDGLFYLNLHLGAEVKPWLPNA